ncbi:hypothetical protein DPSP01_008667 [Paraphaeosphaeria sporulosa]|uniref:Uncharacterized protein n=1 Tax=Paraphaeosphaeria sporulosa TaxID=1460663 RepID=A0A177C069_9PLEO|nr:uncharacterized protein CC84DRAFT_1221817 [Paraphaeosphaeria sporulosa]OAG00289.1 hypothetical protein CC84DRAFT_1221817 [Paraphaeosphaeria sporulosa]
MSDARSSDMPMTAEDFYTEEQKKLVNSPLYSLLRQQLIADMEAYAIEHGIYHDDGPIPESIYKKGHIRNVIGFINFCISDALYNNPYKVVPVVYLASAGLLVLCIVIKEYVIFQATRRFLKEPNHADLFEKSLDTMASIMPVVVTLVLFLFPPLIANT